MKHLNPWKRVWVGTLLVTLIALLDISQTRADETCQSPYLPKITGQEDYVYIAAIVAKSAVVSFMTATDRHARNYLAVLVRSLRICSNGDQFI